jgi:hypothetical protein
MSAGFISGAALGGSHRLGSWSAISFGSEEEFDRALL